MAARIVPVASEIDPALEPFARVRERDLRGRDGLFVAEGEVVVRVLALRGRLRTRALLLERRRVEAMADVLDALPDGVPAYVAPQPVMDAVTGFHIHRGVLALGERGPELSPAALLGEAAPGDLVVGVVGVTNHDNVGGIFRNAAAFGARAVLLDRATCDPLYRKAIRVSVGAALVVPFARCETAGAMLDALEQAGFEALALTPRADDAVDDLLPGAPRALILGAEGPGLPDEVLARARPVRIDMEASLDSLNVAVASGIALHAARKRAR